MKPQRSPKKESPRDRARLAMDLLGWSIGWNESDDHAEDDDTVRLGLDAMASALVDWKELNLRNAAPLDEVLAELGVDDALVETAARLIELIGRATSGGGPGEEDVKDAEDLREELVESLDALLTQLEKKESEDADA